MLTLIPTTSRDTCRLATPDWDMAQAMSYPPVSKILFEAGGTPSEFFYSP
jgi:hypothetical protein